MVKSDVGRHSQTWQSLFLPQTHRALCRGLEKVSEGEWRSVSVPSDGSYGVTEGLISSFPVRSTGSGEWEIVQGLATNEFLTAKIAATVAELQQERDLVADLLG